MKVIDTVIVHFMVEASQFVFEAALHNGSA
jgi:hypothetical protein